MPSTYVNPNKDFQTQGLTAPAPQMDPTLSSQSLASTPSITVPPSEQPADFRGITAGYLEALTGQAATADQEANQQASKVQSLADEVLGSIGGSTPTERTIQAKQQYGVDTKKAAYDAGLARLRALNTEQMLLPSVMQNEVQGRGVTAGGLAPISSARLRDLQIEQMRQAVTVAALKDDYELANNAVNELVKMEFEKQELQQRRLESAYRMNKDTLDRVDRKRSEAAQLMIAERNRLLEEAKVDRKEIYDVGLTARKFGAPDSVIQAINNARTPQEAVVAAGQYLRDPLAQYQLEAAKLENQYRRNQIALQNIEINKANTATQQLSNDVLSVMGSNKIGQASKTTVGTILGVINAVEDLAKDSGGTFTGFYPGAKIVDFFMPNALKKPATIRNEGYLNAINLKVQQWASGATLTEAQTKLVQGMVPTKNDSDKVVQEKLNNLTNFMQQQIKGTLASEGVQYTPQPVNLFAQTLEQIFE